VPNSNLYSNLTVQKSDPALLYNLMKPNSNVFLIYGYGAATNDTITLNLNQFQDSNGNVLSGKLMIKYDGVKWIPSVVN